MAVQSPRTCIPSVLLAVLLCPGVSSGAAERAAITLQRGQVAEAGLGPSRITGVEHGLSARSAGRPGAGGTWVLGLDYRYTRFEYAGLDSRNRDLHRAAPSLAWRRAGAGPRGGFGGWVSPVVATSSNVFKDLARRGSRRDLQWHGGAWWAQPAGGGHWRFELARDDITGATRVRPGIAWMQRDDTLEMALGWPSSEAALALSPAWTARARLAPAGGRWHVVSDERGGAGFDYRMRAWRLGLGLDRAFGEHWRLQGMAGLEFDRRHRFEDDLGALIDRRAGDAAWLGLALEWRGR